MGILLQLTRLNFQGVEKDNKAARQYFETAAHLVQRFS